MRKGPCSLQIQYFCLQNQLKAVDVQNHLTISVCTNPLKASNESCSNLHTEQRCSLRASSHLSDRTDTAPTAGTGFCLHRLLLWRLHWIQNDGMRSLFLNSSLWWDIIYHAACTLCLCERSSEPMMYKQVCHCAWVLQWQNNTNEAASSSWRLLCAFVHAAYVSFWQSENIYGK